MKMSVYSINDIKTGIFYPPMICHNHADALRTGTRIFTGQNEMAQFPADYKIMCIGTFDDQTAEIVSHKPEFLASGEEIITAMKGPKNG